MKMNSSKKSSKKVKNLSRIHRNWVFERHGSIGYYLGIS